MARTASWRATNVFSTRLKLIWPRSSFRTTKMSKKKQFWQKVPGVNGVSKIPPFELRLDTGSKLAWLTPNLKILWISVYSLWLCGSKVAYPIIYWLVPSVSRYQIWQWMYNIREVHGKSRLYVSANYYLEYGRNVARLRRRRRAYAPTSDITSHETEP